MPDTDSDVRFSRFRDVLELIACGEEIESTNY